MRDDGRPGRNLAVAVAAAALLFPAAAAANGVYGTLQLQWQESDNLVQLLTADNQVLLQHQAQRLWLRTLDLHQQSFPRQDLLLESNLRVSEQSMLSQDTRTRSPFGSLRLVHPYFQVNASHQPSSIRAPLTSLSGLSPDSSTTRLVTSRSNESVVNAHVAPPKLPQLDLSWVRRTREGGALPGDRSEGRSARFTFDRSFYTVYGGIVDQSHTATATAQRANSQQVYNAGWSARRSYGRTLAFTGQYDLTDVRSSTSLGRTASTVSQSAGFTGDWRPQPKLSANTTYSFRNVGYVHIAQPAQTDHEAQLSSRYTIARGAAALGSLGLRTVRTLRPDGSTRPDLQRYVTALTSYDGRMRRGLNATASLAHVTNWDPGKAAYHLETATASGRGALNRRLQVDGSFQLAANSDTAAAAAAVSNTWAVRVQGNPLRTLLLGYALRSLRVGPGLLRPNSVSRGSTLDMTWKPARALQVTGTLASSRAVPSDVARNSSHALAARLEPSSHWQFYGAWSRTDQRSIVSVAGQLSSRETVTSRVQWSRNRWMAATAGYTVNDPGKPQRSTQTDVTFTWSFGR